MEASDISCPANHRERSTSFFGLGSHKFQILNQEAHQFQTQPLSKAHCSSIPSYYAKNIVGRPRLEYHTFKRRGLLNPARSTCTRQGAEDTFGSGVLL